MKPLPAYSRLFPALSLAISLAACHVGEVVGPLSETQATEDLSVDEALSANLALDQSETGGTETAPGALWTLAEKLHESLSEREKARLYQWADSLKTFGLTAECRVILQARDRDSVSTSTEGYLDDISDRIRGRLRERLIVLRDSLDRGLFSRLDFQHLLQQLQERARVRLDSAKVRIQSRLEARLDVMHSRYQRCTAAVTAAMVSTLELNDNQVTQIETISARLAAEYEQLREQLRTAKITRERYLRGVAYAKAIAYDTLSTVFDDTQLEIAKLHFAVAVRFHNRLAGRFEPDMVASTTMYVPT